MIKHLYSLLIAAIMDSVNCNPPAIQEALSSLGRRPRISTQRLTRAGGRIPGHNLRGPEPVHPRLVDTAVRTRLPDQVMDFIHL